MATRRKTKELQKSLATANCGLMLNVEQRENSRIHFLDVQIIYENNNIRTTVFRKPTNIEILIPTWSRDKWKYKKATIRSYLNRALMYCSTEEYLVAEIKRIKKVAERHGYFHRLVNKTLEEIKKNYKGNPQQKEQANRRTEDSTMEKEEFEVITDDISEYKTVKEVLNLNKKKPAYRRPNTVANLLKNMKDRYSRLEKSGIYQIPLRNIDRQKDEVYIGATSRNLKDRLQEHESDIKKGLLSTALARRAYEQNIRIKWDESKIITKNCVRLNNISCDTLDTDFILYWIIRHFKPGKYFK